MIRKAERCDIGEMCVVINDGASAYKGVIPDDRWHEPYMSLAELDSEIAAGVQFSCYVEAGRILGVMGTQDKGSVVLIRHAYVRTAARRQGIGAKLLNVLIRKSEKPILIGTWRAARWAINFYRKHEFSVLPERQAQGLLHKFWSVPSRQMETSVVLADQRFMVQTGNADCCTSGLYESGTSSSQTKHSSLNCTADHSNGRRSNANDLPVSSAASKFKWLEHQKEQSRG